MSMDLISIIWLEPKSSRFVKKKIIDRVDVKRLKPGQKIQENEIVEVKYRSKWYKAQIVSESGKPFFSTLSSVFS